MTIKGNHYRHDHGDSAVVDTIFGVKGNDMEHYHRVNDYPVLETCYAYDPETGECLSGPEKYKPSPGNTSSAKFPKGNDRSHTHSYTAVSGSTVACYDSTCTEQWPGYSETTTKTLTGY